jgi:HlyD family secretion protein
MNDENRYEPYQYGVPQEPKFEEPDIVEQDVKAGDKLIRLSNGETLEANFDGKVNLLNVEKGDSVSMGQELIQIVDFTNMQVTMRVDEYDIAAIAVGQECRVTVTALGTTFNSTISHINRIPSNSQGTAYYTVTADFVVTDNVLPGMQVSVVIPKEEAKGVVVLSKSALSFDQRNSAFVYKKDEDGNMVQHPVEIGVDNDNYVEILSGVESGETVYAVAQKNQSLFGFESMFGTMPMPQMGQNGMRQNNGRNQQGYGGMGGGERNFGNMGGGMP